MPLPYSKMNEPAGTVPLAMNPLCRLAVRWSMYQQQRKQQRKLRHRQKLTRTLRRTEPARQAVAATGGQVDTQTAARR